MTERLKMHSPDLTESNIAKIAALFPNCISESRDAQGRLKQVVDFDLLRQELSDVIVEGEQERYRLDWVGKKEAVLAANAPIAKTLRPSREESVDFDRTENLFIEGDNLDALKLLQENYLGKVKMIYIDPPYNTGNDFIYNDDFAESSEEFFARSQQFDEEGNRLIANTESNGRFHSDWLSMMYSRLKLSRNLLADDGVIFISCDEDEIDNLKKIMAELFGSSNRIYSFIWHLPRGINAGFVSKAHEYILVYAKNKLFLNLFFANTEEESVERCNKKIDNRHPASNITFPKGIKYVGEDKELSGVIEGSERIEIIGKLVFKDGTLAEEVTLNAGWTMKKMIEDWLAGKDVYDLKGQKIEEFFFKDNGRLYSKKIKKFESPKSVLVDCKDYQAARIEMEELFGSQDFFDYPKPTELLKRLKKYITEGNDIILDFFAGSATTAHAVMQLNAEDGGNRRFIMVQLPEATDEKSEAFKAGYPNIAEISKERIRRAAAKIRTDFADKLPESWDGGFRVLKVDTTNMKDVYYRPDEVSQSDLLDMVSHVKEDRTAEDLLFQVMLDWGLPLSLPVSVQETDGKTVYFVGDKSSMGYALAACFDELNAAVIQAVAAETPQKFVSVESAVSQDADKTNIKEWFKQLSPETDVKFI